MSLLGRRAGRRANGRGQLRIFFATDLHGSEACFRKLLAAARVYAVDALVMGGDLTGKALRPLVRADGGYRAGIGGDGGTFIDEAAAAAYARRAADAGTYCVTVDPAEAERLADPAFVDTLLTAEAARRVAEWVALAQERLSGTGVQLFISAGNDDPPEVLAAAAQADGEHVVYCDGRVVRVRDRVELLSFGFSNTTPWRTPREVSETELREHIEAMIAQADAPGAGIFNLHVPPVASGLDRCPQLDASTDPPRVVRIGGEVVMGDAGSSAVRQALEAHQPLVGLHGHIHESRGAAKIGSTLALNPGSDYHDGVLRGVIVALDEHRVVHQFTAG
jgi:Icc-related predicted phosphoesterase